MTTAEARLDRPRYRERQRLRVSDLANEQAHRLAARRRHDLGHHRWGIVAGLALAEGQAGFLVQPGAAVDGYGRTLVVTDALAVSADEFERLKTQRLAVWLAYCRIPSGPYPRGRSDCGSGREPRRRDEARLLLTPLAGTPAPWRPPGVPEADLQPSAEQVRLDEPTRPWPVYLGSVTQGPSGITIEAGRRPYAGLAGESIRAPSGAARLQLGAEASGDERRFGLVMGDEERLAFRREGTVLLQGNTTLTGNLAIDEARNVACGVAFRAMRAPPEEAAPWRIYRVLVDRAGRTIQQLRIEIGNPGDEGDPSRYVFAVGTGDKDDFAPCLLVTADCTVVVAGVLDPKGLVVEGPVRADPRDPRFSSALVARWLTGALSSGTNLDDLYRGSIALAIEAISPQTPYPGNTLTYDIKVRNTGTQPISAIKVEQTVTIDGQTTTGTVATALEVEPGKAATVTATYTVPLGTYDQEITIAVQASGLAPLGYAVSASGSATVVVGPVVIS